MTELTDEAVTKLANDCVLAANCMEAEDTFPTGQGILREAARALIDARAERDRLRADAQVANGVWKANLRLQGELAQARADAQAAVALVVEQAAEEVDRHYAAGDMGNPGHWVRSIAPADGLAAVEALRKELDDTQTQLGDWIVRADEASVRAEKAEAELAAAQLREAGLLGLIRWAHETLWELNPSNYDHDEVCKVNDAAVEVILGLAPVIGETHGYSAEWWAERAALSHNGRGE